MPPVMISTPPNAKLRISFIARKDISKEEIFFDYGIRDRQIEWLTNDVNQIKISIEQLERQKTTMRSRPLQDCPVSGCKAVCLHKLADHLRCTHKFGKKTRDMYLARAKKVNVYLYCIHVHHVTLCIMWATRFEWEKQTPQVLLNICTVKLG